MSTANEVVVRKIVRRQLNDPRGLPGAPHGAVEAASGEGVAEVEVAAAVEVRMGRRYLGVTTGIYRITRP